MYSKIVATGSFIPSKFVTNADLEKMVDTSDEWIVTRTGIKSRPTMDDDMTVPDMAFNAAQKAVENLKKKDPNFNVEDIGLIICATTTSSYLFPSCACQVQGKLGIKDCISFDVAAACSGFVYALSVADKFIKTGTVKKALVIGADALSKTCDPTDRSTIILFGDAAGCFIIEASEQPGILSTHLHANNENAEMLTLGNKQFQEESYLQMQGNQVFRIAVAELSNIVSETLEANNLDKSQVDWLVPHQANIRIIAATAKKLDLPMERVILTIEKHGNTSAASIPTAFDSAVQENKFKEGEIILLEAFGGGMTWGSALIKY
ncbi:beta-ketoacyl-ACP synthase III [Psittacicella gerlachiana]|uniref:Beta-ketoacyl-[acyl-carrier-protein] synthase III n=1 Tax=Psittacicella gerlachiana TaxID=2028574 RepID=A0A3A1Y522_9GAMM|nr:beta-ketoacyl-ACP synthase III [Psittacicella gerlachiana]RIY32366.1 3-oxoacyl-ACP synthase [Psittacicella gerlachiana]